MIQNMKGISAVIATLLMLVITVAIAITAYGFISGIFSQQTERLHEIADVTCQTGLQFNVVVRNIDQFTAIDAGDLTFSVDGVPTITTGGAVTIGAGDTEIITLTDTAIVTAGAHSIRVVGPSGRAQVATVSCS